ncbi:hypothetical protein [Novosphingobium sp.]|uniref:hypothetical protein n=1 Tax=Novosphingobium sp. TaxID=1874826 RepID=UPI003B528C4D
MADELIPLLSGLSNYPKRLVDKGDGSWAERVDATLSVGAAPVSASNGLPVAPAYLVPQPWSGSAIDMRAYGTITITCTVAPSAGSVAISPDNGPDYIGQTLVLNNVAGITTTPNVTAVGVYVLSGRAWVKAAFTGGTCFISGGQ